MNSLMMLVGGMAAISPGLSGMILDVKESSFCAFSYAGDVSEIP